MFTNEMHDGEVIIDGIILRLYNENPSKSFYWNNESFIKQLMKVLKTGFNEYLSITSFISNSENGGNDENQELDQEISESAYFTRNRIPKSVLEKYDPDNIDLYKDRISRLEYELTLVVTSVLLNININLSQVDTVNESAYRPYTDEFLNEVFSQEVENGIFEVLKWVCCGLMRCTVLQIFALVPN
jgi:hypothetical protein